jgi:hypothetical protein
MRTFPPLGFHLPTAVAATKSARQWAVVCSKKLDCRGRVISTRVYPRQLPLPLYTPNHSVFRSHTVKLSAFELAQKSPFELPPTGKNKQLDKKWVLPFHESP